jgi:MFS family permease
MSTRTAFNETRVLLRGPVRVLLIGTLMSSIGSGMTLALFVVYLHQVRGIPIPWATAVLSWMAVVGLAASPLAGTLTDRLGPRPVLLGGTVTMASAVFLYGYVTTLPLAFGVSTLAAIGTSTLWSPASTFLARLVREDQRTTAFGLQFMLLNLGLGLGGLVGALIVDVDRPRTFQILYAVDAVTFLVYFVAVASLRGMGGPLPVVDDGQRAPGWREVVRDRVLVRLVVVSLVLMTFGYASMESGLAIFITTVAGLDEHWVGVIFFVNTMVIVVGQLTALGILRGRSRTRALGGVGLLWGVAWLMLPLTSLVSDTLAVVVLVVSMAVFAAGETLWAPTGPALFNALAPEELRGRYNAASGLTWSVSAALGPLVAGALIGTGRGLLWAFVTGLGCLMAAALAQTLRPHLSADQDGRQAGVGSPHRAVDHD